MMLALQFVKYVLKQRGKLMNKPQILPLSRRTLWGSPKLSLTSFTSEKTWPGEAWFLNPEELGTSPGIATPQPGPLRVALGRFPHV